MVTGPLKTGDATSECVNDSAITRFGLDGDVQTGRRSAAGARPARRDPVNLTLTAGSTELLRIGIDLHARPLTFTGVGYLSGKGSPWLETRSPS